MDRFDTGGLIDRAPAVPGHRWGATRSRAALPALSSRPSSGDLLGELKASRRDGVTRVGS
jgi:hypothetical protein